MSEEAPKRRLPVLQTRDEPPETPEEDRPPRHWIAIGAAATFLVWLPLATLAVTIVGRLFGAEEAPGARVWMISGHTLAFFAGAFAGGLLVGRLGGKAGRQEATLAGIAAGVLAWLIALTQGAPGGALVWGLLLVIIATVGGLAGMLGGRLGLRMRPGAAPPRK
jgi:MFS family permease